MRRVFLIAVVVAVVLVLLPALVPSPSPARSPYATALTTGGTVVYAQACAFQRCMGTPPHRTCGPTGIASNCGKVNGKCQDGPC